MADEANGDFSADDLALLGGNDASTDDGAKGDVVAADSASDKAAVTEAGGKATLAAAGEEKPADEKKAEDKPEGDWPKNWRERLAEHISAGDGKAYKRELTRLQRITNPTAVYGLYRELEAKFTSGGLTKIPGKDARPEEIKEFQKALGWTEKPEELLDQIKLGNGAVIGDADKPMLTGFLAAVHGATSAQQFATKATEWYYANQEEQAAALDEADDSFRRDAEKALKDEFGDAFRRKTNAIASIFATVPGGTDIANDGSLYARLMGGRTADGKLIGNDPDIVRWLIGMAGEINPTATVVEDGAGAKGAQTRLQEIQNLRKTDQKLYWSDAIQKEELGLMEALAKEQNRARA